MKLTGIILFFVCISGFSFSQETLQILYTRFGSLKRYQLHINEVLEYKLKGKVIFHSAKIMSMGDSTIVFENGEEVKLSQLKSVKFKKNNFLITKFRRFFLRGGIMFMTLNTCNNLILDRSPVISEKAAIISAALYTTGLLLYRMEYKKIRISKRKTLRISNFNYDNLAPVH